MADLTQFDFPSAVRIARVVRAVEQEPRRARPLTFGAVLNDVGRKAIRLGTYTGSWPADQTNTVTLRGSTATLLAVNLFLSTNASNCLRATGILRREQPSLSLIGLFMW